MKNTKRDKKTGLGVIQYCDISSSEEWKLRLIANLLLQINGSLEARELRELGFQINRFLEKKIVLDHLFWERSIPESLIPKEQLKLEVKVVRQQIISGVTWS